MKKGVKAGALQKSDMAAFESKCAAAAAAASHPAAAHHLGSKSRARPPLLHCSALPLWSGRSRSPSLAAAGLGPEQYRNNTI